MKVFAILVAIIGICVTFAAAAPQAELACCPTTSNDGIGPVCKKCDTTPPSRVTLPCCPNSPTNSEFGHGLACNPCTTNKVSILPAN